MAVIRQSIIIDGGDPQLGTLIGTREGSLIKISNAEAGIVVYGGYLDLKAGSYRVLVWLDSANPRSGQGFTEICYGHGKHIVNQAKFDAAMLSQEAPFIELEFRLFRDCEGVELRLHGFEGLTLAVKSIEFINLDFGNPFTDSDLGRKSNRKRPLNIIYYSCHEILEFDELRMLTDRGHRVFSMGAYQDPSNQGYLRKPLPQFFSPGDWERFATEGMTPEFAKEFDLAIVMHDPRMIEEILSIRHDIPIIYRSIGQSRPSTEKALQSYSDNIKIVRYSERERDLIGFLPAEATIYFGKYLSDFYIPWDGGERILTFHNSYSGRDACVPPLSTYAQLAAEWPIDLYGFGNEGLPFAKGVSSPECQTELYRSAALYLYVYSVPPSYTLSFMEAMGTGVPILAPTSEFVLSTIAPEIAANAGFIAERYELEALLDHDTRLLYSSFDDAHEKIRWLLSNHEYRREVSNRLRKKFFEFFNAERIALQWDELLYSIVR